MTLPAGLLRAYRLSVYRIGDVVIRIGRRAPLSGVLLTAWNPRSRRMPAGWNRRMQHRLRTALRRWPLRAATGGLARWWEDHLLTQAPCPVCLRLARRFRQRAVVVARAGRPARLILLL